MARLRLGAALLLPPPVGDEVDGLRRALGDTALARIPPHITLVPPVNVRADQLPAALAVLRRAAASGAARGLSLTLGPVASFAPASPVLYLGVGGDLGLLHRVRDTVFQDPLGRPLTFPFVPHVTLMDAASAEQLAAAPAVLAGYARAVSFDRIHLLQEHPGRRWQPLADAELGRPAIIGRGGIELELTASETLDPEAAALLEAEEVPVPVPSGRRLVVTARRPDGVAGVAMAWMGPDGGRVEVYVRGAVRAEGIGGHLLAAVETRVRALGWGASGLLSRCGPARFYASRSGYSKAMEL